MANASYALLSVALVSAVSLVGVVVLTLRSDVVSRLLAPLVSFSTGAILGTVFFHLLPEVMEHADEPATGSALVLAGVMLAFAIEKFIHWHHCHRADHDDEHGGHNHPLGALIVIGDGIHNFLDGALIAAAYMIDVHVGIAATIAVVLHEIPQELGDVSLLLHSGFSSKKAIAWNFASALAAVLGAAAALWSGSSMEGIESVLLPIAAGNFLYIATTDLIPELHKETRLSKTLSQVSLLLVGAGLMFLLATNVGHGHEESDHVAHDRHADAEVQEGHADGVHHDAEVDGDPAGNLTVQVVRPDGSVDESMGVRVRVR